MYYYNSHAEHITDLSEIIIMIIKRMMMIIIIVIIINFIHQTHSNKQVKRKAKVLVKLKMYFLKINLNLNSGSSVLCDLHSISFMLCIFSLCVHVESDHFLHPPALLPDLKVINDCSKFHNVFDIYIFSCSVTEPGSPSCSSQTLLRTTC